MRIIYTKDFIKQASKLPKDTKELLDDKLFILSKEPFYPVLHTKNLKGKLSKMYSFRITREWRVVFMFEDPEKIRLIRVGHRKDIYR